MLLNKHLTILDDLSDTWNRGTEYLVRDGILYIKGTDDIRDWLVNLNMWNLSSHEGFFNESIFLLYKLCLFRMERKFNLIIGHSAGGAIGCFIGYLLDIPVISIGSPRFFNKRLMPDLYKFCLNKVTFLELKNDLVPMLPFWYSENPYPLKKGKIGGFKHYIKDYQEVFGTYELGELS